MQIFTVLKLWDIFTVLRCSRVCNYRIIGSGSPQCGYVFNLPLCHFSKFKMKQRKTFSVLFRTACYSDTFSALSHCCTKHYLPSSCPSVRTSERVYQFGSHWTDYHGIRYWGLFRKPVGKIPILLKSEKKCRTLFMKP